MPILSEKHWWLVVANIRDNRFDILSSSHVGVPEITIAGTIVSILVFSYLITLLNFLYTKQMSF